MTSIGDPQMAQCEYCILTDTSADVLMRVVNRYLSAGWVCQGGIAITGRAAESGWRLTSYLFAQALTRTAEPSHPRSAP
jgi:hypothetical protein